MARFTVRLDGADAFAGTLHAWERDKRRAVAAVVTRFTELIAREAKGFAPVDTGALRESIEADTERVVADLVGLVLAGASYASYVEYGTTRMAAQPFLFRAFELHSRPFYDALRVALS